MQVVLPTRHCHLDGEAGVLSKICSFMAQPKPPSTQPAAHATHTTTTANAIAPCPEQPAAYTTPNHTTIHAIANAPCPERSAGYL
jgi:uncharacterized protein (DUF1499 family)